MLVALSISEGIGQSSGDVLRALIDFQKSLGCLGLRLEKNLCLLDLNLETTLFQIALNCWRSLGSFETFAFLKRLFLLRISWMMSLVSHGRFFLLGKIDVGMHSSMMSRNTFFQFVQVDWMSFGSIIVSKSASIRRSLALLKSACLYLHILRCVVGVYWVVSDVCLMHTCRPKWSELANCGMMLQNSKRCMFDIKMRSMIEGSELGEVCVGEVTTWENTKLSISSSILLYKKSSGFTKFTLKSPNSTKLEK